MSALDTSQPALWSAMFMDWRNAYARRRLGVMLAVDDVRRRYRRSILGPLWLTLSMGIMIGAMGLLYGAILNVPLERYFPFLAVGLVFWSFISATISESTTCFVDSAMLSRQMPLPWSLLVIRLVLRNLLMLAHNVAIIVLVLAIFRIWPGMPMLALPFTLALVVLLLTMVSLFLAVIGARFRDMAPIVQNGLQVAFFVTPILWMPEALSAGRAAFIWLVDYNPFHHVLEIVRRPMLGEWPTLLNISVVLGLTALMAALALAVFARGRSRIIFWC